MVKELYKFLQKSCKNAKKHRNMVDNTKKREYNCNQVRHKK